MEKVTKLPLTTIDNLKVGHMVTQDYNKPSMRALTVTALDGQNAELTSRSGESFTVNNQTISQYDLSVSSGSKHAS